MPRTRASGRKRRPKARPVDIDTAENDQVPADDTEGQAEPSMRSRHRWLPALR
jgi:hypothetical protein